MSVLTIPEILIANRHKASCCDDINAIIAILNRQEISLSDNIDFLCKYESTLPKKKPIKTIEINNEAFKIFDDYFEVTRTADNPLETYVRYGIHCALIFTEDTGQNRTTLSHNEKESLLQGIVDALHIGIDYLTPNECDKEVI
ncbi:hypothetical protein ACQKDS_19455 [Serratia sp. NPDC078593]|uniref:hypothetical protein n=1 Tax=unclassified Serratia (in: enterobacteria) TaxID=2647522 RepID=UPI0037CF5C17